MKMKRIALAGLAVVMSSGTVLAMPVLADDPPPSVPNPISHAHATADTADGQLLPLCVYVTVKVGGEPVVPQGALCVGS